MKHVAKYLDSGFYIVSDKAAGELCRVLGQKLPKHGWQKHIMLKTTTGLSLNAWLERSDVRASMRHSCKRGWVWAIFAIRFDCDRQPVTLGKSFTFTPIASTVEVAA